MPDDYSDFDDLLTTDAEWYRNFNAALKILEDFSTGQLVLWPVDDLLGTKTYVACPRRGTHLKITDCWACWCDWAWGKVTASEVLAPGDVER
jgi:hypothetical protein